MRNLGLAYLLLLIGCASEETRPSGSETPDKDPSKKTTVSADEGKKAFEQGLAAAQQKDWDVAIGYFAQAQKADPRSSKVIFNLGLAHAKADHEILAIAWFKAYLALEPNAENAPAVKAETQRLEKAAREKAKKIFETAVATALKLPEKKDRESCLLWVAQIQAEAGDIEGALKALNTGTDAAGESTCPKCGAVDTADTKFCGKCGAKIEKGPSEKSVSKVWVEYGKKLAREGNAQGVQEVLSHCRKEEAVAVQAALCDFYRYGGDLEIARKLALKIRKEFGSSGPLYDVLRWSYINRGDFVPVESLFGELDEYASQEILEPYALKQAELKDVAGAKRSAGQIKNAFNKAKVLAAIAIVQLKSGDDTGAKATAKQILDMGESAIKRPFHRNKADQDRDQTDQDNRSVVTAVAILGNYEGAVALVRRMEKYVEEGGSDYGDVDDGFARVAFVQAWRGDLNGAEATAKAGATTIEKCKKEGAPEAAVARALLSKGKFMDALASAKRTKGEVRADVLNDLVEAQLKSGDLKGAESTIAFLEPESADPMGATMGRADALIRLAEAYGEKKSASESVRLLRVAFKTIEEFMLSRANGTRYGVGRLQMLFEAQNRIGDPAALDKIGKVVDEAGLWMYEARALSGDEGLADLKKAIKKVMEGTDPGSIPADLAYCAKHNLIGPLAELHTLEDELGSARPK